MEAARIEAMLGAALPPLFRCAPAPGGGVRIRTPFLYPDGDAIDLLATDDGGQCVLTDGGETLGWLWLNSVSGTLSAKQEYLLDMVCRCELGLPGYQGELTATAPVDRPEELAAAVFLLGLAMLRVSDLWFLEPHSTAGMEYNAAAGSGSAMPNVWCVRADHGEYTEHLMIGGYVAYGGLDWPNMSSCWTRTDVHNKLSQVEALKGKSKAGFRKYVGMMACFLWDIQAGDWVITPEKDRRRLRYGKVQPGNYWYAPDAPDGCPYTMRRKIVWEDKPLDRWSLSPPFQNTLKCNLSVFAVKHRSEFQTKICRAQ